MKKKVSLEGIYENNGEFMIMFAEDGIMLKGNKSDFMVRSEGSLEGNTTTIDQADAMIAHIDTKINLFLL